LDLTAFKKYIGKMEVWELNKFGGCMNYKEGEIELMFKYMK